MFDNFLMEEITVQGDEKLVNANAKLISKEMKSVAVHENENKYVSNVTILPIIKEKETVSTFEMEELSKNITYTQLPFCQTRDGYVPQAENFEIHYFDQNGKRIPLERMAQDRPILINPTIVINNGSTIAPKTVEESTNIPDYWEEFMDFSDPDSYKDFGMLSKLLPDPDW
ncbi:uncharacterized protein LOC129233294 isoform X1 [Uloborus diversus]|uniref:uncharacterized protein LOC129233294 isoform X1 n=2 Tax=Uloborus diversus TaxID=327109 RepID=UPI00240A2110|nr:uncharacterized protein LOC129233294 isoform X1 [Uloborus diversus]